MSLYDEFRDLAQTLLEDEFGVPATLTRVTATYDKATGKSTKVESKKPCFAVIAPRKLKQDNGTVTVETVARINVATQIGDKLVLAKKTYTVQSVEEVAPDGTPILWMAVVE